MIPIYSAFIPTSMILFADSISFFSQKNKKGKKGEKGESRRVCSVDKNKSA